jgi:hypothetical protein
VERFDGSIDLKVRWSHSNKMGRIYTMDWRPQPEHCVEETKGGKAATTTSRPPYHLAVGSDDTYLRVYEIPYVPAIEEIEYVEETSSEHNRQSRSAKEMKTFEKMDQGEEDSIQAREIDSEYYVGNDYSTPFRARVHNTIEVSFLSRQDENTEAVTHVVSLVVCAGQEVRKIKNSLCAELNKSYNIKLDAMAVMMTCQSMQLEDDTARAGFDFDLNGKFAAMKRRHLRFITPMYDSMDDSDYFQDYLRAVQCVSTRSPAKPPPSLSPSPPPSPSPSLSLQLRSFTHFVSVSSLLSSSAVPCAASPAQGYPHLVPELTTVTYLQVYKGWAPPDRGVWAQRTRETSRVQRRRNGAHSILQTPRESESAGDRSRSNS